MVSHLIRSIAITVNFQESTTILNAYTKKSGNLLKTPHTYIERISVHCKFFIYFRLYFSGISGKSIFDCTSLECLANQFLTVLLWNFWPINFVYEYLKMIHHFEYKKKDFLFLHFKDTLNYWTISNLLYRQNNGFFSVLLWL